MGFPCGSVINNLPADAGDTGDVGSIPRLGISPGGKNGDPLQYFSLEKCHGERSLEGDSPRGHKESDMAEHTHDAQMHHALQMLLQKTRNELLTSHFFLESIY